MIKSGITSNYFNEALKMSLQAKFPINIKGGHQINFRFLTIEKTFQ